MVATFLHPLVWIDGGMAYVLQLLLSMPLCVELFTCMKKISTPGLEALGELFVAATDDHKLACGADRGCDGCHSGLYRPHSFAPACAMYPDMILGLSHLFLPSPHIRILIH